MSRMSNKINKEFSMTPNKLINDPTISDRARFLFVYMASKDHSWIFYQKKICKDLGYKDIRTLRKYLKELETKGWLIIGEQYRDKNGVFQPKEYTLNAFQELPEDKEKHDDRSAKNATRKKCDTQKMRHAKNALHNNKELEKEITEIKKENTKSSSTSFFDSLSANKELLRKDILKKIGRKWIVANSDSLDLTADEIIERFVNDYHDKYSHAYVGNSFQSRGIKKYFQNWIEEQKDTLPKKLFELEPYEEVYKKVSKCTIEEGAEKELKAFVFDKSINLEDFEKYLRYLKRTNRLLLSNIYSTIKDKNYYDYTKGLSEARA